MNDSTVAGDMINNDRLYKKYSISERSTAGKSINEKIIDKAEKCRQENRACLLAIETSCDETAAAVVENGRMIRSSVVASQMETHALYGGVVPEIASRKHIETIAQVVERALAESGKMPETLDGVAVTCGPGLVGALLVGVTYAKAFAYAAGLPLIPVNHIEGHICANYIAYPELTPPFLCLIASGGHSHIVEALAGGSYRLLGQTRDDAAGEAFDKAARVLSLPYPGGPLLDELAEQGNPDAIPFPRARLDGRYDFSFSGPKTALINFIRKHPGDFHAADIAASFRKAIVGALVDKTILAAREEHASAIALAGGVAANKLLRREIRQKAEENGIACYIPPLALCTDNAAMIGSAGFVRLMHGEIADLSLNASPAARICWESTKDI